MCEAVDYSRPPCEDTTHRIPCFCSNTAPAGYEASREACGRIGISGEWKYIEGGGATCYHYPNSVIEGGTIVGRTADCERVAYKGDLAECCQNPGSCFDSRGGTCDPQARSYMGAKCQNYYLSYCSTSNMNDFKTRWQDNGVCKRALDENSLAGDNNFVASLGAAMLGTFFNQGFITEYPGELQNMIYDICRENPLACARYLGDTLCKDYTREDLVSLIEARRFCACHLSDDQYDSSASELGGAPKECDSICISTQNIRPVSSAGDALFCNQSICIIDNVAIDLVKSTVGEINFAQLCGDCSGGNCVCIIKDVDIRGENSDIGGINFEQECGGNERCYQTAANGEVVEVSCELSPDEKKNEANNQAGVNWPWIALSIFLVVMALLIIILFIVIMLNKKK